jgi:hypothetical protein
MPTNEVPVLLTPGKIAAELNVSMARVMYVLRTRNHIRPAARAGILRLYRRETLPTILHELNAIEARHGQGETHV